jgi:uncharacterized protein (UPF0332 family)
MTVALDFLQEAKSLARTGHSQEIRRRTTVSRAYYAAYHHALAEATRCGYRFDSTARKGRHEHLFAHLESSGKPDWIAATDILRNLRSVRTTADYHLGKSVSVPLVTQTIQDVEYVMEELLPAPEAPWEPT